MDTFPNKRATASGIGYGENAIVFVVFHARKELALEKASLYIVCIISSATLTDQKKSVSMHSQLYMSPQHYINLETVLLGEKHEHHSTLCLLLHAEDGHLL